MLAECLAALDPRPGQTVVDSTLGFAGHSVEILKCLGPTGKLVAFDLDDVHLVEAEAELVAVGHPFTIHRGNFAGLQNVLGETRVHGALADLGMSSMQVDNPIVASRFVATGRSTYAWIAPWPHRGGIAELTFARRNVARLHGVRR